MPGRFFCRVMPWVVVVWYGLPGQLAAEPMVAGYDRSDGVDPPSAVVAGQLLLSELSCTACHTADASLEAKRGPNLQGLGSRLQADWVAGYLHSPDEFKHGGTMPALLHQLPEEERKVAVAALLAYLNQGSIEEPKIEASGTNPVLHEFWLKGEVLRGQTLYHQVGCTACHAMDPTFQPANKLQSDLERRIAGLGLEPEELQELGLEIPKPVRPVPLSDSLATKYSLRSLSMFLLAPHLVRPAGRMPSLKLKPQEAADIAAYLWGAPQANRAVVSDPSRSSIPVAGVEEAAWVARGKEYFTRLACGNCHPQPEITLRPSKPLSEIDVTNLDRGCLAANHRGPRYPLSQRQKQALQLGVRAWQAERPSEGGTTSLHRQLLTWNCYACHEREGRGGVGVAQGSYFENVPQVDIGDEGRLPPPLDHVGRKLKIGWIEKVLRGSGDVRPHLRVRMPVFAGPAKSLAQAMVQADGGNRDQPPLVEAEQGALVAGREFMDSGCVQCHGLRGESLPGTVGIDLSNLGERVHYGWFRDFLLNPIEWKRNTRMPSFFPNGMSSNPQLLEGNVDRQIAALWHYLNDQQSPLPDKIEASKAEHFELRPSDRPLILRTFMESSSAGTHAILVGFPNQRHAAFDALHLRLAEIWQGRFINAQATWFDRFAPPVVPLGNQRRLFPPESWLRMGDNGTLQPLAASDLVFQGYRLDPQGIPSFRYRVAGVEIEDRIEPLGNEGLRRELHCQPTLGAASSSASALWMSLSGDIDKLTEAGSGVTTDQLRIKLEVDTPSRLQELGDQKLGQTHWLIAIPPSTQRLGIQYRW
jgi:mono/diheme cytochrome c family protein